MGDQITIPRSFADQIGVADVKNSLKRHYFPIPIFHPKNNTTTGVMWGMDSDTTVMPFLQRNVTFEKLYISGFMGTTINNSTTLLTARLMKNGVSTVFAMSIRNSTTQTERWQSGNTTPDIVNGVASDNFHLEIPLRNEFTQISAVLVFRERKDS